MQPHASFPVALAAILACSCTGAGASTEDQVEVEEYDYTLDACGFAAPASATEEEVLVGIERQYFAQAPDGTVCHFGEEEDVYEDGAVVETDGWLAGEDGVLAGIFMPGTPEVGMVYEMYHDAEEVETAEITVVGEPTETPAGTFDDTLTVLEDGPSIKKYARGIGEIYDDGIELISY
jgi:hypothetical protein